MKKNLLALVLVLLACAVASLWPRLAHQKLSRELCQGLEKLWDRPGQVVELYSTAEGVDARVQVALPPEYTPRQEQWNFALLRFVSQRYGPPRLGQIALSRVGDERPIEEQHSTPPDQSQEETANQAHLELIRRQAQSWLDQNLGPSHGLALVDGTARVDSTPVYEDSTDRHYLLARPEEGKQERSGPGVGNRVVAPPITVTRFTTRLVLVVDGRVPDVEQKLPTADLKAQLGLQADEVRVVVLP
ncbi:MAG: hypothetical protein U0931_11265 [Vulcanimicrobiota bacterium]